MISDTEFTFLSVLTRLSSAGFSIGVGFDANKPIYVHSSYRKDWQDTYVDQAFLLHDPTIIHGQKYVGHFTWTELDRLYPDNPVFPAARRFGLVEGNTLSLKLGGVSTIVSCSGEKWGSQEVRQAKAAASAIHHLFAPDTCPNVLSAGELEVVRMMASGLRDKEIAEQLDISVPTVRKRRRTSFEKTGTLSSASLVSFAITNGWF